MVPPRSGNMPIPNPHRPFTPSRSLFWILLMGALILNAAWLIDGWWWGVQNAQVDQFEEAETLPHVRVCFEATEGQELTNIRVRRQTTAQVVDPNGDVNMAPFDDMPEFPVESWQGKEGVYCGSVFLRDDVLQRLIFFKDSGFERASLLIARTQYRVDGVVSEALPCDGQVCELRLNYDEDKSMKVFHIGPMPEVVPDIRTAVADKPFMNLNF